MRFFFVSSVGLLVSWQASGSRSSSSISSHHQSVTDTGLTSQMNGDEDAEMGGAFIENLWNSLSGSVVPKKEELSTVTDLLTDQVLSEKEVNPVQVSHALLEQSTDEFSNRVADLIKLLPDEPAELKKKLSEKLESMIRNFYKEANDLYAGYNGKKKIMLGLKQVIQKLTMSEMAHVDFTDDSTSSDYQKDLDRAEVALIKLIFDLEEVVVEDLHGQEKERIADAFENLSEKIQGDVDESKDQVEAAATQAVYKVDEVSESLKKSITDLEGSKSTVDVADFAKRMSQDFSGDADFQKKTVGNLLKVLGTKDSHLVAEQILNSNQESGSKSQSLVKDVSASQMETALIGSLSGVRSQDVEVLENLVQSIRTTSNAKSLLVEAVKKSLAQSIAGDPVINEDFLNSVATKGEEIETKVDSLRKSLERSLVVPESTAKVTIMKGLVSVIQKQLELQSSPDEGAGILHASDALLSHSGLELGTSSKLLEGLEGVLDRNPAYLKDDPEVAAEKLVSEVIEQTQPNMERVALTKEILQKALIEQVLTNAVENAREEQVAPMLLNNDEIRQELEEVVLSGDENKGGMTGFKLTDVLRKEIEVLTREVNEKLKQKPLKATKKFAAQLAMAMNKPATQK